MTNPLDLVASPPPKPEPRLDRFGRYLIPDLASGRDHAYTRATSWAKTVAEQTALNQWKERHVALGLVQREDLRLAVAAIQDPNSKDGKKKLNDLCELAKEHAGAESRATIGSALHSFTEAIDKGHDVVVPAPFDKDIAAYIAKKKDIGLEVSPRYVERIVVLEELGVAGTLDRVVKLRNSRIPLICDVKTGTTLDFSWTEIAIQLAIYAHADRMYDVETGRQHRMLEVNQRQAVVLHLPAREGRCIAYFVDLEAGWEATELCRSVRRWRNRKDLAVPVEKAG